MVWVTEPAICKSGFVLNSNGLAAFSIEGRRGIYKTENCSD